jgi:hypothetical protein
VKEEQEEEEEEEEEEVEMGALLIAQLYSLGREKAIIAREKDIIVLSHSLTRYLI